MNNEIDQKYLSLLGLCRRAGKLEAGFDAAVSAIREGRAKLLIAARDISGKSFKNIEYEAAKKDVPVIRARDDTLKMSRACGRRAGIFAICDCGFSSAVLKECKSIDQKKEGLADDGKIQNS